MGSDSVFDMIYQGSDLGFKSGVGSDSAGGFRMPFRQCGHSETQGPVLSSGGSGDFLSWTTMAAMTIPAMMAKTRPTMSLNFNFGVQKVRGALGVKPGKPLLDSLSASIGWSSTSNGFHIFLKYMGIK